MIRPWPDDGRTLAGVLVVDLSRQLPGPFVTLELQRLGAEVVRLEAPGGDPLRAHAPGWHDRLNAGKESVVCDLKAEPALGRALCRAADVVVEGFRPGVAERLGVGPADLPEEVVYCSIRGFGETGALRARAGHDVNYLGLAGVLDAARPTLPPLPIADLAAGALTAVSRILVGLLGRERTGRGSVHRISMTDEAHRLAVFGRARDGESVVDRALEGGLACYDLYAASDGRWLSVGALEPPFFALLCRLLGVPGLAVAQFAPDAQDEVREALAARFARRSQAEWVTFFGDADVAVAPVLELGEVDVGERVSPVPAADLGAHTAKWAKLLGVR